MTKLRYGALLGLAVLAPVARAEAGDVLLRYWWAVGDQVRWTIEARMTGPVRPSDDFAYQTVDARVHLTLTVRALVTAVSPADVATVRVSIDRLAGDVDLGAAGKVHTRTRCGQSGAPTIDWQKTCATTSAVPPSGSTAA